jgi:hypothetical protein
MTRRFGQSSLDIARSGGVSLQANAVAEMIKRQPARGTTLLRYLRPGTHEHYGAAIIGAVAESASAPEVIAAVRDMDSRGFASEHFRATVCATLETVAKQHKGLDDGTISLLESWLAQHQPSPPFGALNRTFEPPEPVVVPRWGPSVLCGESRTDHRSPVRYPKDCSIARRQR